MNDWKKLGNNWAVLILGGILFAVDHDCVFRHLRGYDNQLVIKSPLTYVVGGLCRGQENFPWVKRKKPHPQDADRASSTDSFGFY